MPTANIAVYLTDDQIVKFLKNKEKILNKAREVVKKEVV